MKPRIVAKKNFHQAINDWLISAAVGILLLGIIISQFHVKGGLNNPGVGISGTLTNAIGNSNITANITSGVLTIGATSTPNYAYVDGSTSSIAATSLTGTIPYARMLAGTSTNIVAPPSWVSVTQSSGTYTWNTNGNLIPAGSIPSLSGLNGAVTQSQLPAIVALTNQDNAFPVKQTFLGGIDSRTTITNALGLFITNGNIVVSQPGASLSVGTNVQLNSTFYFAGTNAPVVAVDNIGGSTKQAQYNFNANGLGQFIVGVDPFARNTNSFAIIDQFSGGGAANTRFFIDGRGTVMIGGTNGLASNAKFNIGVVDSTLFPDVMNVGGGAYFGAVNPVIRMDDQGQIANERLWDILNNGKKFTIRTIDNAGATVANALVFTRGAGIAVTNAVLAAAAIQFNGGTSVFSGTVMCTGLTVNASINATTNTAPWVIKSAAPGGQNGQAAPVANTVRTNGANRLTVTCGISASTTLAADIGSAEIWTWNSGNTYTNKWGPVTANGVALENVRGQIVAYIQPSDIFMITNLSTATGSMIVLTNNYNEVQQ